MKRVLSILSVLLVLLTAASCRSGTVSKSDSITLPGVYEDDVGMTWILARDGTLRITDRDRQCVLGTWYQLKDRNDRLAVSFPSFSDDEENAEDRELKYSGDGDRLDLRLPGTNERIASLERIDKGPKTAGLKEYEDSALSGLYVCGDRSYSFTADGTAKILDPELIPGAGRSPSAYGYTIEGSRLIFSASAGSGQTGRRWSLLFEAEEDGITLFADGLEGIGVFFALDDSPEPAEEPGPGPIVEPAPHDEPAPPTEPVPPTELPVPADPTPSDEPMPPDEPEPPPEEDQPIGSITIMVNALRVRSSPSTSGTERVKTTKGEVFRVYEISGSEEYTWYRIGENAWIADRDGDYVSFSDNTTPMGWDPEYAIGTIEILVDALKMRKTPNTSAQETFWPAKGDKYWVYEISSGEGFTWYKIGPNAWIADKNGDYVRFEEP